MGEIALTAYIKQQDKLVVVKAGLGEDARLYMDDIRSVISDKSISVDAHQRGCVNNAVCLGRWTKTRLHQSGYEAPDMVCDLCGEALDTLIHRVYFCRCTEHNRATHTHNAREMWHMRDATRLLDGGSGQAWLASWRLALLGGRQMHGHRQAPNWPLPQACN